MNKVQFIAILIILQLTYSKAKSQCYGPLEEITKTGNIYFNDAKRDPHGNLYVIAYFFGTVNIRHLSFDDGNGSSGVVLLKFDRNDTLLWGHTLVNTISGGVRGDFISLDSHNDIIISGTFSAPYVDFDCIRLFNDDRESIYVAKISKEGEAIWAIGSKGPRSRYVTDLKVGRDDEIVVVGNFVGANNLSFGNLSTSGVGGYDMFIAKFSDDGEPKWLRSFGGTESYDYVYESALDSKGDVIITGTFTGKSLDFDGTVLQPIEISENYYIVKLSSANGQVIWVKTTDTGSNTSGESLVVDENDNIYTTGRYITHDMVVDGNTLNQLGMGDMFLIKYDPLGNYVWGKALQGTAFESGRQVIYYDSGHLSVSGYYYSPILSVGSFNLPNSFAPVANSFVAEFDGNGDFKCHLNYDKSVETFFGNVSYDSLGNLLLVTDEDFQPYDLDIWGDESSWIGGNNSAGATFTVDLGDDIQLCQESPVKLNVKSNILCGSSYLWSDGSADSILYVNQSGLYWVQISKNGITQRDSVFVKIATPFLPLNLPDTVMCRGSVYQLDITDPSVNEYESNLGNGISTFSITQAGTYWVRRINNCSIATDTFNVSVLSGLQSFNLMDTLLCEGQEITIDVFDSAAEEYESSLGSTTPQLTIRQSGTYWIRRLNRCESKIDSITVEYIVPVETLDISDANICLNSQYQIDISDPLATEYQSNLGNNTALLTVSQPGVYWVKRSNRCFISMDTFEVKTVLPLTVDLGSDSVFCNENFTLELNAANIGASYRWSTGENTPSISIQESGTYSVDVFNQCETVSDAIDISINALDEFFIPNVITPNGDGKNDTFIIPEESLRASLSVFNRWGNQVYHNEEYDNNWDGDNLKSGVYYYQINSTCFPDAITGSVHVLK